MFGSIRGFWRDRRRFCDPSWRRGDREPLRRSWFFPHMAEYSGRSAHGRLPYSARWASAKRPVRQLASQKLLLRCNRRQMSPVFRVKLGEQRRHMGFDRARRHEEGIGNCLVGVALGK
jgi:hypothetical protein